MAEFDKKLHTYLSKAESDRDIAEGALLLLQLNRNKILYSNILQRPKNLAPKLFYELEKQAKLRAIVGTSAQITKLSEEVKNIDLDKEEKKLKSGMRADHEDLPEAIKQLYVDNLPLLQEVRSLHEKMKMQEKDCDRAETLALIKGKYDKYVENWNIYDNYKIGTDAPVMEKEESANLKDVANARSYISKNKQKLFELKGDPGAQAEYAKLLAKIQDRVDIILSAGEQFTDEFKAELMELGISF